MVAWSSSEGLTTLWPLAHSDLTELSCGCSRPFSHHDTSGIYLHLLSIIQQQSNYRLESEASIAGAMQLACIAREKGRRGDDHYSVRKREASRLKLQACQYDVGETGSSIESLAGEMWNRLMTFSANCQHYSTLHGYRSGIHLNFVQYIWNWYYHLPESLIKLIKFHVCQHSFSLQLFLA